MNTAIAAVHTMSLVSVIPAKLWTTIRSVLGKVAPATRGLILLWVLWVCFIHLLPVAAARVVRPHLPGPTNWSPQMRAVETPLSRWDSRWYFTIATHGYSYAGPDRESPVRFYPLYPMLMAAAAWTTPLTVMWAGTLVSALALLGTMLLLAHRAREEAGSEAAVTVVQALLFFPSAFILATVYSDGLALFCMLLAVTLARRGRWWGAGLAGAAVALTRSNGFLVLLPLFVLALGMWRSERRWRPLPALLLAVAGAAAFPLYLGLKYGDPLLYLHFHSPGWAQHPRFFPLFLWDVVKAVGTVVTGGGLPRSVQTMSTVVFPLNIGVLVLLAWALVASLRQRKWDDAALLGGGLLLASSAGNLDGAIRYCLLYFPVFLRMGERFAARPILRSIATPVLLAAQTVVVLLFSQWGWVL